jgi:hypothetical protein
MRNSRLRFLARLLGPRGQIPNRRPHPVQQFQRLSDSQNTTHNPV